MRSASSPQVSVVIPTRNRVTEVSQAVDCVLGQEGVAVEVIVVDDGSSDETPEVLAEMARTDPRLRVITHSSSCGVAEARNRGALEATGEWLGLLDDDDVWAPTKLAEQLDAARDDSVMVYAHSYVLGAGLSMQGVQYGLPDGELTHERLLRSNPMPGGCSNAIVRRAVFEQERGFDRQFSVLADWELWIRLTTHGSTALADAPLVGYVKHGESMHVTQLGRALVESEDLRVKHPAVDPDTDWFYGWLAGGQAQSGARMSTARVWLSALRRTHQTRHLKAAVRAVVAPQGLRPQAPEQIPVPVWLSRIGEARGGRPDAVGVIPPTSSDHSHTRNRAAARSARPS